VSKTPVLDFDAIIVGDQDTGVFEIKRRFKHWP